MSIVSTEQQIMIKEYWDALNHVKEFLYALPNIAV